MTKTDGLDSHTLEGDYPLDSGREKYLTGKMSRKIYIKNADTQCQNIIL